MSDQRALKLQAYIAEFTALRTAILDANKRRENLKLVALAASGALFSFALWPSGSSSSAISTEVVLFLVPPITLQLGGLSSLSIWRSRQMSQYIADVLGPKADALVSESPVASIQSNDFFSWETSQKQRRVLFEAALDWVLGVVIFLAPGIVAQLLVRDLLADLDLRASYRAFYWANWVIIAAAGVWKLLMLQQVVGLLRNHLTHVRT